MPGGFRGRLWFPQGGLFQTGRSLSPGSRHSYGGGVFGVGAVLCRFLQPPLKFTPNAACLAVVLGCLFLWALLRFRKPAFGGNASGWNLGMPFVGGLRFADAVHIFT